jgi:hypothetical protein
MTHRLALLALAAVTGLPTSVAAQTAARTTAKSAPKSSIPHTRDGKPDLTGVWQAGSTQRGNWEEANSGLGVGGTGRNPSAAAFPSFNDRPADSEAAPYQPWAAKKVLEAFNRRAIDDPSALCLPLGVPRLALLGLFPAQIVQTPKQVVILYEYMSVFRVIPLNATHPDDLLPSYMGNSVGHWEGDTLVVDVIGFNDKTWLAGAGTFHSDALHVVERYTRIDRDRINYDVTIDDPKVLTKRWTIHSSMMLREGTRLEEYVCAENNLDPGQYEKLLKEGVKFTRE